MRALLALLLFLVPTAAFAHTGHGDTAGLLHGFMHPIGGLDHVLAMVAVGVFAVVLGGRALWLVPAELRRDDGRRLRSRRRPASPCPIVELGIALSSIVIGAAAALGRPMPVAAAMALVGVFAVFHGHAHGAEMPAGALGFEYALGFVLATAALHLAGIGAAIGVSRLVGRYGKTAAQVAGGLFAVGGLGILAGWL